MKKLSIVCLLTLLVAPASFGLMAQPKPRIMYAVEIVVFRNLDASNEDNELWFKQDPSSQTNNFNKSIIAGGTPSGSSDLSNAVDKMIESGSYEILVHKRWFQNANLKSKSNFVRVRSGGNLKGLLDGQVMLYSSRYLHVVLDLLLKDDKSSSDESGLTVFQIQDHQRIKNTANIFYFDHPKFAVLVKITPIKK